MAANLLLLHIMRRQNKRPTRLKENEHEHEHKHGVLCVQLYVYVIRTMQTFDEYIFEIETCAAESVARFGKRKTS